MPSDPFGRLAKSDGGSLSRSFVLAEPGAPAPAGSTAAAPEPVAGAGPPMYVPRRARLGLLPIIACSSRPEAVAAPAAGSKLRAAPAATRASKDSPIREAKISAAVRER